MKYHLELDIEFKKNPYKGTYIVIEGIDGCGKTTQVAELTKYFKSLGKEVVHTREPRKEGIVGDLIHKVLLGKAKMPTKAIQYLFTADRVVHYEDVIMPALKLGKIVISDRCFWSAIVYGILDRMDGKYDYKIADQLLITQSIMSMYHQFIVPDYTFYLKISLETSLARIIKKHQNDQKEIYESKEKLLPVIKGYDWLSEKFKNEIITLNGERPVNKVTEKIIRNLNLKS